MGNVTRDMTKMWVRIKHPQLGEMLMNEHLVNLISEPLSDTSETSDPGVGGGRVKKIKKDTARKISIEVNNPSDEEFFLRRVNRYKKTSFELEWEDGTYSDGVEGGNGQECFLMDNANDKGADTITFEIECLQYSGD